MNRSALIDATGVYRYALTREWGPGARVCWVLLNPSTADGEVDDPTVRRCIDFARRWGYAALDIVNLFAWRCTDPAELETLTLEQAVGPENDRTIGEHLHRAGLVVAAWGHRGTLHARHAQVSLLCRTFARCPVLCLGLTSNRQPRHPLYVVAERPLVPYARGMRCFISNP